MPAHINERTVRDVWNSLTSEQQGIVELFVGELLSFSSDQKKAVHIIISEVVKNNK